MSAAGVITTVAGNGIDGYSGDGGPATAASLAAPHNVVATSDGGFLIADAGNQRVRQVGADGVITTLIGDGVRGYSGDGGPASAAQLSVPKAVGLTAAGDVLIADEQNNRIRFVGTVSIPTNTSPPTIAGNATQGQQLTAKAGGWGGTGPLIDYQWQRCSPGCSNISGATNTTYLVAAADVGATLRVAVTGSNSAGSATASSAQTGVVSGAAGTPPVNTSLPSISGVAQLGQTLTAAAGSWSGTAPISYTYQWRRCDAGGSGCVDIGGAVGNTYLVASADVGSSLRVAVTASNGSSVYASAVSGSAPRSYWRFGGSSGALVDEQGVSSGSFVGNPQRGVSGLLVGDADVAVDFNGTSQYADVPAAAAWTPPAFSIELTVRPSELPDNRTIWSTQGTFNGWWLNTGPSGNVRMFVGDGSAWRSQSGPVLNAGSRYHLVATYDGTNARLYVNGALVSTGPNATMAPNGGANVMRFGDFSTGPGQYWPGTLDDASFYPAVLSASQVQAHYDASITGSLATSAATAVVTTVAPVNTSPPTVSGTAQQGQTLTADPGSWSGTAPISYTYQWQRCSPGCSNISGATNATYLVAAADVGATLRVAVTGSNSAGSATASSAQTGVVSGSAGTPPVNTSLPSISGLAQLGQTLTAAAGSWSGTAPISYTYQWRRCDAGGSGCVDIGGAVGNTYLVASADVGSSLRVAVTASNGSSVYASAVSGSAPRSYWRFGGSSGALVDEQGVSSGSFVGNPQRGVSGLLVGDADVAVDFNGTSQYADVPAAAAWTPPAFSIELTVRPSELPDNRTIWSTQGTFNGWWLNTGPSGNVRMFVGDGSAWRSQSGPVLNAGSRYHLVATYDGTNARLYVNGALVCNWTQRDHGPQRRRQRDAFRRLLNRPRPVLARHARRRQLLPRRPQRQPGAGALQREHHRQPRHLGRDRRRHHGRTRQHLATDGVGNCAAGADADRRPGQLVGHRTDLLHVSVAAV